MRPTGADAKVDCLAAALGETGSDAFGVKAKVESSGVVRNPTVTGCRPNANSMVARERLEGSSLGDADAERTAAAAFLC
jgi:hypothetical protein